MAHGDAVAHADGGNENGSAAGHAHAGLDGLGYLVQMGVARNDFTVGADDADKRTIQFFLGVAHGIEKTAVGRTFHALRDIRTAKLHGIFSPVPFP